jgi:hypothetical protein
MRVKHLRSERGIALPLVIVVMLVLGISIMAVIDRTAASQRNAGFNRGAQDARSIAEAGFHSAAAGLAKKLDGEQGFRATLPMPDIVIRGHNVTREAIYQGSDTWRVTGRVTVPNPSGPPAAPLTRRVSALFRIENNSPDLEAWKGVYAYNQGADCFMQNQIVVKTPVYIRQSNSSTPVCIKNNMTRYLGAYFAVKNARFVSENLPTATQNGATVGQRALSSQPGDPNYPNEFRVPDVHIEFQCGSSGGAACNETHGVWRCTNPSSTDPPCYSSNPPDIPKPPVDFGYWRTNAKPGPFHPCTADKSSGTAPSFTDDGAVNIFPSDRDYNCEVWVGGSRVGKLEWKRNTFSSSDVSGPKGTLKIEGVVYFSGKLEIFSVYAQVEGKGTIYVHDYIKMDATPGAICGKRDTSSGRPLCNWSEGSDGWDPGVTDDLLLFVTGQKAGTSGVSMDMLNQFEFQGAVYTVGKFILQNSAQFKGPLVTEKMELKNNAVIQGWTPLNIAFPGQPVSTTPKLTLVAGSWSD